MFDWILAGHDSQEHREQGKSLQAGTCLHCNHVAHSQRRYDGLLTCMRLVTDHLLLVWKLKAISNTAVLLWIGAEMLNDMRFCQSQSVELN